MKTKTVTASFPIGAWVRDQQMRRLSGDIEKNPITGAVRFAPSGGEIIGTGELCKSPVYRVKFAESFGFVFVDGATCYQCGATDDDSHNEYCADKTMRSLPHEPGYGPE